MLLLFYFELRALELDADHIYLIRENWRLWSRCFVLKRSYMISVWDDWVVAARHSFCWIIIIDTAHLVEERLFLYRRRLALQHRVVAFGRGQDLGWSRNSLYGVYLPTWIILAKFLVFFLFAGFVCLPKVWWNYVNFRVLISQHLFLLFCKLKDVVPCLISHYLMMSHVLCLGLVTLVCFLACNRLPGFRQAK